MLACAGTHVRVYMCFMHTYACGRVYVFLRTCIYAHLHAHTYVHDMLCYLHIYMIMSNWIQVNKIIKIAYSISFQQLMS